MNEILTKLRAAYSNLNYEQFCEKANFRPSQYALDKFQTFKRGIESLTSFDEETLTNLIN
ncbi:MAG: hypothetical protein ACRC6M_03275 [Microcystaceae cyanobacterium]